MNIKSFLTWKLLYLFVVVVNLCHAILDDFWNPMNPIHLPKILKSSLKKSPQIQSFELLFLYSLQPLWPLPVIVFPEYPTLCSYTHFPAKKSQFPQKKIHPWKNISWPVPLTSFGPRFKRKKEKQILLITHRRSIIPTKTNTYHHYPQVAIFFLLLLNLTIIYFSWRDYLSYNYIHTNQEFFDLCAIYDAVNVDEPIKTTFPPRKLHKLLFWLFLAFHVPFLL